MDTHAEDTRFGFRDEDFPLEGYDNYPEGFCTLEFGNQFQRARFPMFRRDTPVANNVFAWIELALLLASQMIVNCWETLQIFVRRQHDGSQGEWLDSSAELPLSQEEVVSQVKNVMPEIEFDPDMKPSFSSYSYTHIRPKVPSDLVVLDYKLIGLPRSTRSRHVKISPLFLPSGITMP